MKRVRVEILGNTKSGEPKKKPDIWYRCELCSVLGKASVGKNNPKGHKRVWVDHDPPLVPLDAPHMTWTEYVERLFCTADKLRVLCDDCHYTVTQQQNAIRREFRYAARREKDSPPTSDRPDQPDQNGPDSV